MSVKENFNPNDKTTEYTLEWLPNIVLKVKKVCNSKIALNFIRLHDDFSIRYSVCRPGY